MKNKLINAISPLGYDIYLQGTMAENEEYPDSFFTFWNSDSYSTTMYDNTTESYVWIFELNFYSNNPTLVNTKLKDAVTLLKAQGFINEGVGHDVYSDVKTHTGRGITLYIRDENNV